MEIRNINEINAKFKYISGGSEGYVYGFGNKVLKEFYFDISKDVLERKKEILVFLSEIEGLKKYYPHLEYFVQNDNGDFIAYVMKKIIGKNLNSSNTKYNSKTMIHIIQRIKIILQEFLNYGLLYMDVRKPNIIVNRFRRPIILDIDSITRLDNPIIDVTPDLLKPYLKNHGKINENSQTFMLNFLSIQLLYQFLQELELDNEATQILNLYSSHDYNKPDTVFDHEYLIDHVKRKVR